MSEIEEWVRTKHRLPSALKDVHIEGNELVLCFQEDENLEKADNLHPSKNPHRKRRAHRRRNRMKTRGWAVVARFTNSRHQTCAIYKPFVDALQKPNLTEEEQKKEVEGILKANRNKPSEASIQYFLENTLEYLNSPDSHPRIAPSRS